MPWTHTAAKCIRSLSKWTVWPTLDTMHTTKPSSICKQGLEGHITPVELLDIGWGMTTFALHFTLGHFKAVEASSTLRRGMRAPGGATKLLYTTRGAVVPLLTSPSQ